MSGRHRADAGGSEAQRLDKWLWFARVVKSRTLAAALVVDRKVRVNRERASKPSQMLRVGDVVTVAVHARVRVLKVLAAGARRGPPAEACLLYEDLTPAVTGGGGAGSDASPIDHPTVRGPRRQRLASHGGSRSTGQPSPEDER
jgi:ribosome-associated heat shock protein Hsp15